MAESVAAVLERQADNPARFEQLARLLDNPHHRVDLENYVEETVRRESGDVAAKMFDRMRFYAELVEREGKRLDGKEQFDALTIINEQFPHIVEAIDYALSQDDASHLAQFASHIAFPLLMQGKLELGASVFNRLLTQAEKTGNRLLEITAGTQYGRFLTEAGKLDEANKILLHALELAQLEGNESALAEALSALGYVTKLLGRYEESAACYKQTLELSRKLDDKFLMSHVLSSLGSLAAAQNRWECAKKLYAQSLDIAREIGNIVRLAGDLHNLAVLDISHGDYHKAQRSIQEALKLNRLIGNRTFEQRNLGLLGRAALEQGHFGEAKELFAGSQSIAAETGTELDYAMCEYDLGEVVSSMECYEDACLHLEKCIQLVRRLGARETLALGLAQLGIFHCDLGEYEVAEPLLSEALAISKDIGYPLGARFASANLSLFSLETGKLPEATEYLAQALCQAAEGDRARGILRTLQVGVLLLATVDRASQAMLLALGVTQQLKRLGLTFGKKWHRDFDEATARCSSLLEAERLRQLEQQASSMSIQELIDYVLQALAELKAELSEPHAAESPVAPVADD